MDHGGGSKGDDGVGIGLRRLGAAGGSRGYDEDVVDNAFYKALAKKQRKSLAAAALRRLIVSRTLAWGLEWRGLITRTQQ